MFNYIINDFKLISINIVVKLNKYYRYLYLLTNSIFCCYYRYKPIQNKSDVKMYEKNNTEFWIKNQKGFVTSIVLAY